MSPEARLKFHQAESGPLMEELRAWCNRQFDDRLVEPNSALGDAIGYLLDHWEKLTLFLREAGAPLDNNVCEQALKRAILHRKNALFYKTLNGAHVGDMFIPDYSPQRHGDTEKTGKPMESGDPARSRSSTHCRDLHPTCIHITSFLRDLCVSVVNSLMNNAG